MQILGNSAYQTVQVAQNRNTTMAASATSGSEDDQRSRGQQSVLISQRAKKGNTPTESNRTGRFGGYFPLGYKEGFSQWVCALLLLRLRAGETNATSGQVSRRRQLNIRFCPLFLTCSSRLRIPRQGPNRR